MNFETMNLESKLSLAFAVFLVLFYFYTKLKKPKKIRVTQVHVARVQGETYSFGQYLLHALVVFGLFIGYAFLTAGIWESACSPSRPIWQEFAFPIVAGLVVLVILTFSIGSKIFRDNNAALEAATPAIFKLLALVVLVGGIGFHISVFGGC